MSELPSIYEYTSNLAEAEAPSPLPEGEYRASVRSIDAQNSKSSGKPMAVLQYVVSPDQYPADFTDGDADGTVLMFYRPLEDTPRNRYLLRKFCEIHGVKPSNRLNLPDFIGQDVILSIKHEEYQGVTQARATPIREA